MFVRRKKTSADAAQLFSIMAEGHNLAWRQMQAKTEYRMQLPINLLGDPYESPRFRRLDRQLHELSTEATEMFVGRTAVISALDPQAETITNLYSSSSWDIARGRPHFASLRMNPPQAIGKIIALDMFASTADILPRRRSLYRRDGGYLSAKLLDFNAQPLVSVEFLDS